MMIFVSKKGLSLIALIVGIVTAGIGGVSYGQNQNLSPGVGDIGRMAGARVPEQTIIDYIKGSGLSYHLTPDDIIYLNGQGVTPNVMSLLQSSPPVAAAAPAPSEPPPTPAPAPPDASAAPSPQIDLPYFQTQLTPYGQWIDLPPYGQVWRPGAASDPLWRPYCQGGHWVMTDAGWYWAADDPWGAVVFHYGRWILDPDNGWVWIPGYNWGPSWVCWRRSEGFYGWAPLPPRAEFVAGVGISIGGGVAVEAGFDFGLGAGAFCFVGFDHIWAHDYGAIILPPARVTIVFGGSVVQNSYHIDNGRFVVEGFGRHDVEVRTGRPVEVVQVNKQVIVEHTTVVNNVTSVRNVTIRNNVTNVRNVSNTTNVRNVNNTTVNNTRVNERTVEKPAAQHPATTTTHTGYPAAPAAQPAQHPPQYGNQPGAQHPPAAAQQKKPAASRGTNSPSKY